MIDTQCGLSIDCPTDVSLAVTVPSAPPGSTHPLPSTNLTDPTHPGDDGKDDDKSGIVDSLDFHANIEQNFNCRILYLPLCFHTTVHKSNY